MAPAVDAFEAALLAGELRHGNHPILRWNASNAVFDVDPAGARKLNKARSTDRIDGLQALVMACGLAARDAGPDTYARSEEETSELQALMRNSYDVYCLKKKKDTNPET